MPKPQTTIILGLGLISAAKYRRFPRSFADARRASLTVRVVARRDGALSDLSIAAVAVRTADGALERAPLLTTRSARARRQMALGPDNNIVLGTETSNTTRQPPLVNHRMGVNRRVGVNRRMGVNRLTG